MEADRIVVTGANGFIGRHVARQFAQKGCSVIGVGHGEWSRKEWESWGLSGWYEADITLSTLQHYAGSPSTIVHCAGSGSVYFSVANPLADFERTVMTTAHVLEYGRLCAPFCTVVYPSSASVYGTAEIIPIRENFPVAPISQYGVHKLMAEHMVASYARQFGTNASIVRLFSVYGCGLRKQLLWDACCKFGRRDNIFMGTGDEVRDWLHVEDAAELLLAAAERASAQCPIVNGGTGEGTTVREVLRHLGSGLTHAELVPSFTGTRRIGDPSRYVADIEGAKGWGWSPKHRWQEGVSEYAAWWQQYESGS